FPAGIFQPPYFDATWPSAINFGGVGLAMGHELTHAFDTWGSRRDARAQARNWWSAATADAFADKAKCIAAHLSTYEAAPGIPMEASRVLDEAIADIGGLNIAHRAYRQLAAKHGEDPSARFSRRLTHEQLFFVASAQNFCVKQTPEFEQAQARSDNHALGRVRVNATAAQSPAFCGAFTCEPGEPMHARIECDLW
ncbi:MAG TPA: M13-type metalloendopeptidase, partial [Nannocystis sp.]